MINKVAIKFATEVIPKMVTEMSTYMPDADKPWLT